MGENGLHSPIPGADHRVDDVEFVRSAINVRESDSTGMSAYRAGVPSSIRELGQVVVTNWAWHPSSVREVATVESIDDSAIDEVSALFAGEAVG